MNRFHLGVAALCLAIFLSACTSTVEVRPSDLTMPETLLSRCPDIPKFSNSEPDSTVGSHIDYTNKLMSQYIDCAVDKDKLNEAVRKAFQQPEPTKN